MKNIGKKLAALALLGSTTSLMAIYAEHTSLYKDPRVMGMGGANVAVGSYSTAVFYNPAGLANIKKEHGFVFDFLNIGASISDGALSFADELSAADGDAVKIGETLTKYAGDNMHIGIDNYTSLSKNSDAFAWSIGVLAASDINMMSHSDLTLDSTSRAYGGVVLGFAKPYETEFGRLDVGLDFKYIQMISWSGNLDAVELGDISQSNDATQGIRDALNETDETGMAVDIGFTYHPWVDNYWHPAFGLSVMNIGTMDMNDAYGGQPMTVNVGMSITPEFPIFDKFVLAVDYVDLLNNFTYKTSTEPGATEYTEDEPMKRLRFGAGLGVFDTPWISLTLNGGWYQSAYTAGVNLEFLLFKLNAATYQEELGAGDTSIVDRRYMAQIGIGW